MAGEAPSTEGAPGLGLLHRCGTTLMKLLPPGTYPDGNVEEYKGLLEQISNSLPEECRAFAVRIVLSSARQPENLDWMQKANDEFSSHPVVRKPLRPYCDD